MTFTPNIMADADGKWFHEEFNAGGARAQAAATELTRQFAQGEVSEAVNYQPGNPAYKRVWDDIIQAAEEFNNPGVFTTFIAYEWTSLETGNNLHRNVIFRDGPERAGLFVPYTKGVPMGADMLPGEGAPSFLVYALRDPLGANLDRVQMVKGWIDADGTPREKVYDVVWSDNRVAGADGRLPPVGNTVNLSIPGWTNTIGASELGTLWQDPDFGPAFKAFYYARMIEIPTPRWTAYDAVKFDLDLPDHIPMITQERAYTSPIWYAPKG